jgi:superfamily I DNA and/or RNA helicase
MTAYNNSVNKITKLLQKKGCLEESRGSVLTIDKSQGIDKEAIILLIEKDNNDLIEDPRRLNVALTRAKSKLIVVGSEAYLCQMDVWAGTLGKLLGDYMHDLSKKMIEDMINYFQDAPSTK